MKIRYTSASEVIKGYSESVLAKGERGDCVVRAVASAYEITYEKAHSWVSETFNRKPKRGTFGFSPGMNKISNDGIRINRKLTKKISPSDLKNRNSQMSVGTFIKLYDKGTYIVKVTGHAFTIKDGVVIGNLEDCIKIKRVVKDAWKVGK
jgi:hypothetical protein